MLCIPNAAITIVRGPRRLLVLVALARCDRLIRTGEAVKKDAAHAVRLRSRRHYDRRHKEQQHAARRAAGRPEISLQVFRAQGHRLPDDGLDLRSVLFVVPMIAASYVAHGCRSLLSRQPRMRQS